MVMKALRDGAKGGVSKFILFGFLVLATGGLVLMDVGGFFRGGVSGSDVARVGDHVIKAQTFDSNLRRTVSRLGMSTQEAYKLGYVGQILSTEVRGLLVAQAASDLGVSIPDSMVAKQVSDLVTPLAKNGESPKNILEQILRAQGLNEAEFTKSISRDMGNNLITNTFDASLKSVSDDMFIDLYKFKNETRNIRYITFMDKDVRNTTPPSDSDLENLYRATQETYAQAETRIYKIVTIDTAALEKALSISDEEIKSIYESNIDLYTTAASWTLDQALVPTKDQAQKIFEQAKAGKSLKGAVESVTTNVSGYIGEQDFTEAALLEAVKQPVMDTKESGITLEPIKSPLGWHVVTVKSTNPVRVKPLSEVQGEIKEELVEAQIIDQQYELANAVDDMLASGASLEDVAEEIDLNITTLPAINQYGVAADGKDALKDFTAARASIIETGATLQQGETSPIFESMDGQFMAVYLQSVTPKSYTPFDDVKDELAKRWSGDQSRVANKMQLGQYLMSMTTENKSLADIAKAHGKTVKSESKIARNKTDVAKFPVRASDNMFEAKIDAPLIVDVDGGAALAVVTGYDWPKVDPQNADFLAFKAAMLSDLQNESLGLYLTKQQDKYKATVNQRLLDQLYGPQAQTN